MKRRLGFTLVELLVVIATISLLIAILLPVLKGARRRALVLVCPIAYVGVDGFVHLTDPQGGHDVAFENSKGCLFAATWSPGGRTLATSMISPLSVPCSTFLDPMSGNISLHTPASQAGARFLAWLDEQRYYELSYQWVAYLRDRDGKAVLGSHKFRDQDRIQWYSVWGPLPRQCAPMCFVAQDMTNIVLLRKDLSTGRRLSIPNGAGVCIDPLGEWIAWVDVPSSRARLALKRLSDPASVQPILGDREYAHIVLCDWSEDGNWILANVSETRYDWSLVLFDKNAQLVRKIPTAVAPQGLTSASWRKYGH